MYYLIREIDSYDCYVTKCETLEKLAKELLAYGNDGESIVASSLSKKEQRELQRLIEKQKS